MESIVTSPIPLRDSADTDIQTAAENLANLESEARALGNTSAAAPVHHAMGRIFIEQLGDAKSAAVCYENAFLLNPEYRPNLESARRLFASSGVAGKALALHRREETLLRDPAERAESLRAQAVLLQSLGREQEAMELVAKALDLVPDHPGLLKATVDAAARAGDRLLTARLLIRSADATVDPVHKARLLRRAVLLLEALRSDPGAEEAAALRDEAVKKLYQADANDPVGVSAMLQRAVAANDWEAVLRLSRQHGDRTGSAADRTLAAAIAAYRLGRISEGLAEVSAALEDHRRDGALLALRSELAGQQGSADLADLLRQRAESSIEPSERAHLKIRAALLLTEPLEKEQLLSEALADNPGDAAAIALHARLVMLRDPAAAADRFVALAEALESHSPQEAAGHHLEAGAWQERLGNREEAAAQAQRALKLVPRHPAALRLLTRTLPAIGASTELADLLERCSGELPRAMGAELLARAAALVADDDPSRSIHLARRAAEMARGLVSPRGLETWCTYAFRAGDFAQLSQALEARADSTSGSDAADLLLEASELSRAAGDDVRSTTLLRKARGVDPSSAAARAALLSVPILAPAERADLLQEEARVTFLERAAALQAERALVLAEEDRVDEAVQACAQALALTGVDLAVLRQLGDLQLRRGDHGAALAVLLQIAESVPEGRARAEAYARAAEVAEWRMGDPLRAADLYRAAAAQHPQSSFAWAHLARLLSWTDRASEAAEAFERLADAAQPLSERIEALRQAASLHAHRGGQPAKAIALLRTLLAEAPSDVEAAAQLLELIGEEPAAAKERADLRTRLATRCQDPRVAAVLRLESAEDRMIAGERDQAIADYRRALALNPRDRVALDRVEDALRGSREKSLLADHLAFRCAFAEGDTRAALSLEQAEILAGQGRIDEAGAAYQQALASDPDSLIALKGARQIAELKGDKEEVARLLAREASLAKNFETMIESALRAADMGQKDEAVDRLTSVLEADPANGEVAKKIRGLLGEDAAGSLASTYEKIGHAHADARMAAIAWIHAGRIQLRELDDAPAAFFAAGRALARDPENLEALELRADAGEAAGRLRDAAEALQKRLARDGDAGRADLWRLRLGRLHAQAGDAEKALPLLREHLDTLEPAILVPLASGASSLAPADAIRVYRRVLDAFVAPAEEGPTAAQLAGWSESLGRQLLGAGDRAQALEAFRRALRHEPGNVAALRQIAELGTTAEAIDVQRALFSAHPSVEPLRALARLYDAQGRPDGAFCASAVLAGLESAAAEERAVYEVTASRPPPVDLPRIPDDAAVHAEGDEGPARELFTAAMPELARALATDMSGGRGALVKGDNPVRRVVAAIARALGMPEPQIHLARSEPAIVAPLSADVAGILVGAEVPKRWSPRQQRFLYARALAHIRRGTQALAPLSPERLAVLAGELARVAGIDLSMLPVGDAALAERLSQKFAPAARARLAPAAARLAAEEAVDWEALALGIRESAERVALALCGDPAAAISIVSHEGPGGLARPEVCRLARFAVSDAYFAIRSR